MRMQEIYARVPHGWVRELAAEQAMGRLVSVRADGLPRIGLHNFVYAEERGRIELHLSRHDEQLPDLLERPRCLFEVDEVMAVIPSYWVDPTDAGVATTYHRTVIFECAARVVSEPGELLTHLEDLMAKHQPEGGYEPLRRGTRYVSTLRALVLVALDVVEVRTKFKLGQNRSAAMRRRIVGALRERDRAGDARTAEAVERVLALEEAYQPA
jgi:uncharacterized protein